MVHSFNHHERRHPVDFIWFAVLESMLHVLSRSMAGEDQLRRGGCWIGFKLGSILHSSAFLDENAVESGEGVRLPWRKAWRLLDGVGLPLYIFSLQALVPAERAACSDNCHHSNSAFPVIGLPSAPHITSHMLVLCQFFSSFCKDLTFTSPLSFPLVDSPQ